MIPFRDLMDSQHSFQEDYEQENGQYENRCCCCHERFLGNKHRVTCKLCSEASKSETFTLPAKHHNIILKDGVGPVRTGEEE